MGKIEGYGDPGGLLWLARLGEPQSLGQGRGSVPCAINRCSDAQPGLGRLRCSRRSCAGEVEVVQRSFRHALSSGGPSSQSSSYRRQELAADKRLGNGARPRTIDAENELSRIKDRARVPVARISPTGLAGRPAVGRQAGDLVLSPGRRARVGNVLRGCAGSGCGRPKTAQEA